MQKQNFVTLLLSLSVWYLNIFSNGSARKAIICDSWWWVGRKCGLDLFTSAHLLLHCDAPVEGDWREPLHIIHRQAEAEALKFQHGHQASSICWELRWTKKRSWGLTSKVLSCIVAAFILMAEKLGEVEGKGHHWGHQSIFSFQDILHWVTSICQGLLRTRNWINIGCFF